MKFEVPGMWYRRYASGWWRPVGDVMRGTKSGVWTRTGSDAVADAVADDKMSSLGKMSK